jgi:hypothetical protein
VGEARWAASGFEHFVYRLWTESLAGRELAELADGRTRWEDLPPAVRAYVEHYRRVAAARLDEWPRPFPAAALRPTGPLPGQAALW